ALARCAQTDLTADSLLGVAWPFVKAVVVVLAPLLGTVFVVGTLSYVAQFGFLVSGKAITPDLTRLDPLAGGKRLFSVKALFDTGKGFAKIILVGLIVFAAIKGQLGLLLKLSLFSPVEIGATYAAIAKTLALRVVGALSIIAAIDYLFQRATYLRKMRMTRQEVKDEFKNAEGDPKVKARIRRVQTEMAQRRMMHEVPTANVVVTNPTHVSVALRYERGKDAAPVVVAKGKDLIALKIREIAKDNGIPCVERPPLARELHKRCKVGGTIPLSLYQAVAEILAYIYSRDKGAA
ncbi:MAG: flagellar biosynthesis protein FlhB, partial [Sphingopyxis terrae]